MDLRDSQSAESATLCCSFLQPAVHCIPGDLLHSGNRRFIHALDAESGNFIERAPAMLEPVIDSSPVPAEGSPAVRALEATAFAPPCLVESEPNDHFHRRIYPEQTIVVGTAEEFHGPGTHSLADLMNLKIGLKPYHTNGLQLSRQHLFAEAPLCRIEGVRLFDTLRPAELRYCQFAVPRPKENGLAAGFCNWDSGPFQE